MSSMSISRLVGCLHGRVSRGLGQFRAVLGKEVLLALFGSKFSHEILKAQVTSWASMVEKNRYRHRHLSVAAHNLLLLRLEQGALLLLPRSGGHRY